ncbi:polysaccharide deacetylase family protein [Patescibacteria group bacterium]|nr:polysaccharide deacetylase family protein [Patescibacteria group bacterium]
MNNNRIFFISWLVIPVVLVWLSTNYLIGLNRQTKWQTENNPKESQAQIQSATDVIDENIQPIKWNGQGLVTIGFDDAWNSQFGVAYPILEARHLKATLAVPTGLVGDPDYMSWSQIRMLSHKGWEITSHTRNHSCNPTDMTDAYVSEELGGAKVDLKNHGIIANNFVSPCGVNTPNIINTAKEDYLSLRTSGDGYNDLPVTDPYGLKVQAVEWNTTPADVASWLATARNKKQWVIIVFHQIQNDQSKYATSIDKFTTMMDEVANSGLQVVLPTQALELQVAAPLTPTVGTGTPMPTETLTPTITPETTPSQNFNGL